MPLQDMVKDNVSTCNFHDSYNMHCRFRPSKPGWCDNRFACPQTLTWKALQRHQLFTSKCATDLHHDFQKSTVWPEHAAVYDWQIVYVTTWYLADTHLELTVSKATTSTIIVRILYRVVTSGGIVICQICTCPPFTCRLRFFNDVSFLSGI